MDYFQYIDIPQQSPEWHKFRLGKIGASQAAAVMGLSPFTTKLQVWEEIVYGRQKPSTSAMERGKRMESEALSWYNKRYLFNFVPKVVQCKKFPDLIASLDGWDGKECLEIKCPNRETHAMARSGNVPEHYYPQLQHQMFVTNTPTAVYLSYDGNEGIVIPVERDPKFIREMLAQELAFIQSIIDYRPPEPCSKDWVEVNDQITLKSMERYKELSSKISLMEEEKEELRRFLTGPLEHPRCLIGDAKVFKTYRKGNVDIDRLVEDYKITGLDQYRKPPIESWRIQV